MVYGVVNAVTQANVMRYHNVRKATLWGGMSAAVSEFAKGVRFSLKGTVTYERPFITLNKMQYECKVS